LVVFLFSLAFGAPNPATRTLVTGIPGAACLDGSPPAYYFAPGSGSGADKWLIFHQGGGWCTSLADCYGRSLGKLGSSKTYPPTEDLGGGYFSKDATVNPVMYNWNKVYIPYCDGASFAGNNHTIQNYQGHQVYYRGFLNLQAVHKDLVEKRGLKSCSSAVISGCSAGGLATYLHVDWWHQNLNPGRCEVRGMPDSGFFLDWNAPGTGPKYGNSMRWVAEAQNVYSGVNQKCIAANKGKEANCFFAEHTALHIETPIFPLQSEYDSWQAANVLGSHDPKLLNPFGEELTKRFHANVLRPHPRNGGFLDSCFHHCGEWDSIVINGHNSGEAMQRWYTTHSGTFIQAKAFPCDACCHP